jgi:hypothetical protein
MPMPRISLSWNPGNYFKLGGMSGKPLVVILPRYVQSKKLEQEATEKQREEGLILARYV